MEKSKSTKIKSPRNHTMLISDSDRKLLLPQLCHAHDTLSQSEIINKIFNDDTLSVIDCFPLHVLI